MTVAPLPHAIGDLQGCCSPLHSLLAALPPNAPLRFVGDLIEPFRPVVDLLVIQGGLGGEMTSETKRELAAIFEYLVRIPLGDVPLQIAIENELETLKLAVNETDASLLQLPVVIPLQKAGRE